MVKVDWLRSFFASRNCPSRRQRRFLATWRRWTGSTPIACIQRLEDRTLLAADFGDAPDTGPGTGTGNYNTLLSDGGPSHTVVAGLFLGASVDDEADGLPSATADGDNIDGALPIDEDGLNHPASDLDLTIGAFPTVSVIVTNTTGSGATLYGWIDTNADGVFDNATERASAAVPDGTAGGLVTLTFPQAPVGFTGTTYARFRLSTDGAAADPTGAAGDGEVEDYRATIVEGSNGSVAGRTKIASNTGGMGMFNNDDSFGVGVTSLGDLDNDGVNDMAVGAYFDDTGGSRNGAIYIQFLNSDGTVKSFKKIAENTGGMGQLGSFSPLFGSSVASLGDLDGDGITDLAVGATGDDTGGFDRGAVYILFLNADGTVKGSQKIASDTGGLGTLSNGDEFGVSVTSLGDFDRDGVTDLAVGANRDDTGGADRGAVHILLMNSDGTVKVAQKIANSVSGFGTLDNGDQFGKSLASLGDMDGDGIPELAVGTDRDDTGSTNRGAVYILFLNSDGTVKGIQKIAENTGGFGTLNDRDQFGRSVAALGDLDGNGVTDLAVGADLDDTGGDSRGAVYVVFLNADGTVKRSQKIADNTSGFGTNDGLFLGSSVTNLGDLNGDGRPDLAIGAVSSTAAGGAVYVTFLDGGPPTVATIARHSPATSPTNADEVTFRVAFSEVVTNVDLTDFVLSGTSAADGTISSVVPTSDPTAWHVTVTGLAASNGTINLDFSVTPLDIVDLFGNALANTTPEVEQEYEIDNVPPVVSTLSPADDFLLAATHTNLVVTFNQEMQKGAGNVVIKRSSDDSIFQTVDVADASVTVSSAIVTIDPSVDLEDQTEYYVQIDAGAFEDVAGNAFAGINDQTTWNFTAVLQTLTLDIMAGSVSEAGGPAATTARVTRIGDPSESLVVMIDHPDDTELFLPTMVMIPAGDSFVDFDVETVNDGDIDGDQTGLLVTVSADGYVDGMDVIDVLDDDTALDRTLGGHLYGTVAADTYRVLFDITIDDSHTLTITPASTLRFAAGTTLFVDGTLSAMGAVGTEIVFTSNSTTPARGDWQGITITASSANPRTVLDHTEIAFAFDGLEIFTDDSRVTLSNSHIHDSASTGIAISASRSDAISANDVQIIDNEIFDNDTGIFLSSTAVLCDGSFNGALVHGNEIRDNATGIALSASTIGGCIPARTSNVSAQISSNFIHHNDIGISSSSASSPNTFMSITPRIENNLITDNSSHGLNLLVGDGESLGPRLFNNTIANNGGAGIFHDADARTDLLLILNNIVTGNSTGIEADAAFVPLPGTVGHNNVFNNTGGDWINYPAEFGDLTGIGPTGLPADVENNVSVDPLFVSMTDFHLQSTSPLIDAGNITNAQIPATDFDGDARLFADIGFDEFFVPTTTATGLLANAGSDNRSGIDSLAIQFADPVTINGPDDLLLFNHSTGMSVVVTGATLSGNGTTALTWNFNEFDLPDGYYTAELAAAATTPNLAHTATFLFWKLAGDLDGDGIVNFNDTVPISLNFGDAVGEYGPGDADGDGIVNFNDTVPLSLNFGESLPGLTYDFGDAPDPSFATQLANDGARHVITGNLLFLGTDRDAEADGQQSVDATGDGADEDGVLVGPLVRGTMVPVTITSSGTGFVNAWIDFNADGDWDDPGEQVFVDEPVVANENNLQIAVPTGATSGDTFARFRLTGSAGYSYFGLAPDGEVEDYLLTIIEPMLDTSIDVAEETLAPVTEPEPPLDPAVILEDPADIEDAPPDHLTAIPAPTFTRFDHPLSRFSTEKPDRHRRR